MIALCVCLTLASTDQTTAHVRFYDAQRRLNSRPLIMVSLTLSVFRIFLYPCDPLSHHPSLHHLSVSPLSPSLSFTAPHRVSHTSSACNGRFQAATHSQTSTQVRISSCTLFHSAPHGLLPHSRVVRRDGDTPLCRDAGQGQLAFSPLAHGAVWHQRHFAPSSTLHPRSQAWRHLEHGSVACHFSEVCGSHLLVFSLTATCQQIRKLPGRQT